MVPSVKRRVLYLLAPGSVITLIAFSLLPLRPHATLHGTFGHLALHIAVFSLVALPSLLLTVTRKQKTIGVICLGLLAVGIEWSQCLVFHQRMEWEDVLLDCLGTLTTVGLLAFRNIISRRLVY